MFFDVFWQLFAKKSCKRLSVREKKNKKFLCKLNFCSFFERILAFAGIVEGSNCFSNIQHHNLHALPFFVTSLRHSLI